MTETKPLRLFPMVRHLSARLTPLLFKSPLSANHVTAGSLLAGLGCGWYLSQQAYIYAALLLVIAYIMDNCDGEIARLKNQASEFGARFDSFVDWIVHAVFFVALGFGHMQQTGQELWMWIGWVAGGGATFNYFLGFYFDHKDSQESESEADEEELDQPRSAFEWVIFFFRELSRADFCFLVLGLALFDVLWVLLPAGAIGAQVYWMLQCIRVARRFHV